MIKFLADGYRNLVANIGTSTDKTSHGSYTVHNRSEVELVSMYRSSWLARRIIDLPAKDATRRWRNWVATKETISEIEALEIKLEVQSAVRRAQTLARLLGVGAIYMSTNNVTNRLRPLDPDVDNEGGLRCLSIMSPRRLRPSSQIDTNPDSEWYGMPSYYILSSSGTEGEIRIHPSRLVIFYGDRAADESDDLLTPASLNNGWASDSILQSIWSAVMMTDAAVASVGSMLFESKIDIIRIPDLMKLLQQEPEYADVVSERIALASRTKSINNAMLMDTKEEVTHKLLNFGGISEVMDRFFQVVCGASEIPMTRLFGRSPGGLNATGESDIRLYYDNVAGVQSNQMGPAMAVLDHMLVMTAIGKVDKSIHSNWRPLWSMTDNEKMEVGGKIVAVGKGLREIGVTREIAAEATINSLVEMEIMPGLESSVNTGGDPDILEEEIQPQVQEVGDAAPRTLYVHRKVLNGAEILAHYEAQGYKKFLSPADLHVTVVYSKTPVDWMKMPTAWGADMTIPAGGPRLQERLGTNEPFAQVLLIKSDELSWRHESLLEHGATSDFPDYQAHITLSYEEDLSDAKPYTGRIELGPEIWEEVNENWKKEVLE